MELKLRQLRKQAGYTSREQFAKLLGVSKYTYRAWETGITTMNIEQLWQCCVALDVSPNKMLGWESPPQDLPQDEIKLVKRYRACTDSRKESLLQAAKDAVTLSNAEKNDLDLESLNDGVGDVA